MNADHEHDRRRMTELHIASRGIGRAEVLAAFEAVPRECFVPEGQRAEAYDDCPLPIGEGQTISQPYIVARMVDALELRPEDRVLEIGTGSGYAAAILAKVAGAVFTVERIRSLAERARRTLATINVGNVHIRVGDGTLGWPEHAPYDAIVVAAGGPVVPQPLLDQLAIGGRLVMPVTGKTGEGQALVRVRRTSERDFEQEELLPVRFVPLIGARGHSSPGVDRVKSRTFAKPGTAATAAKLVREVATPIDDATLDRLVDRLADARVVLLGESTHGTTEMYALRARLTRRLIEAHGFDFVAAEADWPDAAQVDAYVRGARAATPPEGWTPFARFPTWMWRNEDVDAFVGWLRDYNAKVRESVGFHGLDLYSMYSSMGFVIRYLDEVDPHAALVARRAYARLASFREAPEVYGLAVNAGRHDSARDAVVSTLRDLLAKRLDYAADGTRRFFDAAQNARVVTSSEQYYRAMFEGRAESWNLRDTHMFDTLRSLLAFYGPTSKGVVWAHNSHVGDARATEASERGELNVGQLCRQAFGDDARIVGFSTHHGEVFAATEWGEPGGVMTVRDGHPESYEHVFHAAEIPAFVLSLREATKSAVRDELGPARLFRAIGVVYAPTRELKSHYFESTLPAHLDELVWIDETHAVRPLPAPEPRTPDLPETYPFGL